MTFREYFNLQETEQLNEACWKGYHKKGMKTMFGKRYPNCVKNKNESLENYINRKECPGCGGVMVSELQLNEKKDACYHKVKSRYKVWPSAYASGALVRCRKKGAANWGNKSNESITQEEYEQLDENLKKWFSDKWVRFGPDGKIKGDCARGSSSEGKPKCLPQSKAYSLGKKGRAAAAARKRREDPNPERSGKAINVNTKKESNEETEKFPTFKENYIDSKKTVHKIKEKFIEAYKISSSFSDLPETAPHGFYILKDGRFIVIPRKNGHDEALLELFPDAMRGASNELSRSGVALKLGLMRVGKYGSSYEITYNPFYMTGTAAKKTAKDIAIHYKMDIIDSFETVRENYADGKNPGRKGLAKRSGVNTKASVSSLRKTARNSTGEKARMAHWMANMKAGKAKKK